jgi:hypothetical protein
MARAAATGSGVGEVAPPLRFGVGEVAPPLRWARRAADISPVWAPKLRQPLDLGWGGRAATEVGAPPRWARRRPPPPQFVSMEQVSDVGRTGGLTMGAVEVAAVAPWRPPVAEREAAVHEY